MGIGKRIKEARLNKHLTQAELAKLIGVTKGAIANYENDTSHPKEPVMYALIDTLEVEPNFLFQDCVNILKNRENREPDDIIKLKKIYANLNQEGRHQLMVQADLVAGRKEYAASPSRSKTG